MGSPLNIKTTNKKIIYGNLETPKGKSKGLIIFVHGLTGSQNEHIFVNGTKYFIKKWYSTYRFNLYGEEKNARKLETTNLKEHIHDLSMVTRHFQKQWIKKIFLVGHSLGGLTILYSNISKIAWIILWDSSIWGKELLSDVTYNKKDDIYIIDRWQGYTYNINKGMYKDFSINPKQHLKQVSKINIPIKIICAEKWLKNAGTRYYKAANAPKDFVILQWASHCFDEKGAEEKLFTETHKRIRHYL